MRRLALALATVASAALAPIVPACSSTPAASADGGWDSAVGPNQFANQPCDPTLPNACAQAPCASVRCDPTLMVCVETQLGGACQADLDGAIVFESGADTGQVVNAGCTSDLECPPIPSGIEGGAPTVLACAFSAFDGCGATGTCVTPDPPLTKDGSVQVACGCDGQPVAYVTEDQTAAPVSNAAPCSALGDGGVDAAPDAADAGTDATANASDASDAADDAPEDAATDG